MHKRKAGVAFIVIGAVLIILALLLFLYNEWNNAVKEEANKGIYDELYGIIQQAAITGDKSSDAEEPIKNEQYVPEETVIETETTAEDITTEDIPKTTIASLRGYDYIGILEIPILGLNLPVLSDWDDEKLEIAPCRQFGSAASDDLVIAGHNYRRHFKYLNKLSQGDEIRFIDMEGTVYEYTAAKISTLDSDDVDAVIDSEYDLILYTCTYTGSERIAVFFKRVLY